MKPHPNIMKLYESIDTHGHVYLVTELLDGMQLNAFLKMNAKLSEI
jgi:serine/threonine protein kinase